MSSVDESILGPPDPEHPICPNCDVPMWMMKVENFGSGDEQRQHRIYGQTKSIIDPWTLIHRRSFGNLQSLFEVQEFTKL